MNADASQLTARQQEILRRVVEEYVATGQPVGSKTLVERARPARLAVDRARRARRARVARPAHASAHVGRARPDRARLPLLRRRAARTGSTRSRRTFPLDLHTDAHRGRVGAAGDDRDALAGDAAARARLGAAARGDDGRATSRCCCSSREVVMVVVITSAGGVTKRIFHFDEPVDPGLAKWAGEYLNETVAGLKLGTALLRRRFDDPGLGAARARVPRRAAAGVHRARLGRAAALRRRRGRPARRRARRGARGVPQPVRARREARRAARGARRARSTRAARSSASAEELDHPALREVALVGAVLRARPPRARRRQPASARCGWTTRRRSAPFARRRSELSRFVESVYDER